MIGLTVFLYRFCFDISAEKDLGRDGSLLRTSISTSTQLIHSKTSLASCMKARCTYCVKDVSPTVQIRSNNSRMSFGYEDPIESCWITIMVKGVTVLDCYK